MHPWTLLTATTPHLHPAWVVGCAVIALVLVLTPINLLVVMFHETGHAAVSIVCGGGFAGINLHASGDGVTHTYLTSRLGDIPITAAGYLAPGAGGLLISWAYGSGHTTLVLAVLAIAAAVFAAAALNLFAFVVAGLLAGLSGWALLDVGTFAQSLIVLVLAWVLLLGGTIDAGRTVISVDDGEDHAILEELTWVPAMVWALLFVAANAWCLYAGGRILLSTP